ncbi:hypothetical protein CRG98_034903 [Punica granatum]|uniref:RNase H type-1 domain-containing protein n=1 Tax=Punica granatum TaxID=22663 RepID=A0A2I0IMY6_PUNGR|nr:hypothetical protein CRG98_034903 [Punica granatum]
MGLRMWALIDDTARVVEPTVQGRMICEFVTEAGTWEYSLMDGYLSHTKLLHIASHRPPARDQGEDSLYWTFEPTGNFSVKTAYCFLAQAGWAEEDRVWKSIWSWRGPQRVRTFLWLVAHARLLTNEHRARRHLTSSTLCDGCSCGQETTLHAFRDCSRVQARPPPKWAKLNTDGALRGNPGLSGAGGIVRDADGLCLGGYVRNIDYASSTVAEL